MEQGRGGNNTVLEFLLAMGNFLGLQEIEYFLLRFSQFHIANTLTLGGNRVTDLMSIQSYGVHEIVSTDIFKNVLRGVPNQAQSSYIPPQATFADSADVSSSETLRFDKGKLFLGVIDASMKRFQRQNKSFEWVAQGGNPIGIADDRHMITVAGSRSGKGRAVIIPNMLSYTGSILATDPKGELATITAERRHRLMKQAVYVLDPFGVANVPDKFRASFNPLSILEPTSETLIEDAGLIADALVVSTSKDEHWDASTRELITALLLHYALNEPPSLQNLPEIRRVIRSDHLLKQKLELIADSDDLDGVPAGLAESFLSKPENELGSVLSNTRRQTSFLDFRSLHRVLNSHTFDLRELKESRATVYLCLPATRMSTCNRWLRLFINLAISAFETTAAPPPEPPILMCLDEFATLGHMQTIENAAGQIAGFGVKLWPILQDLSQLEALYQNRWQTFMGNAGILQFFGNSDLKTLEWISKRLGDTTLRVMNKNEVNYKEASEMGAEGESWSNDVRPLLSVDEISKLFSRDDSLARQLIIWSGRDPIILQRANYDKHHLFQ